MLGSKSIGLWALFSALAAAHLIPSQPLGRRELSNDTLASLRDALRAADANRVATILRGTNPVNPPTSLESAISIVQAIATRTPNIIEYAAQLMASGVLSRSVASLFDEASDPNSLENSHDNKNPDPTCLTYPKADQCDAPYSVPESQLRSAIFIPQTFTFGQKPPVILFPGTGNTGYITYRGNFIPLLTGSDYADPVWVNVPGLLLDDAQVNAEYAAYAINYISCITKSNVSIIAWSQGNIDTQWAFKYWPSTRKVTSDHIAISADYKGTVLANVIDISGITNDASVVQQEANSNFIQTLRSDDGDSAYVPTTSIYSSFFDEIVQPQSGTGASAFILDKRGVGASNYEPQVICRGQPGGGFYSHESLLASSLAFSLAKDALTNVGPGKTTRLNLEQVCGMYLAPGLGLREFLITEEAAIIAILAILLHMPKVTAEPPIKEYTKSVPVCLSQTRQNPPQPSAGFPQKSPITNTTNLAIQYPSRKLKQGIQSTDLSSAKVQNGYPAGQLIDSIGSYTTNLLAQPGVSWYAEDTDYC